MMPSLLSIIDGTPCVVAVDAELFAIQLFRLELVVNNCVLIVLQHDLLGLNSANISYCL
jgi:hypothetical protein